MSNAHGKSLIVKLAETESELRAAQRLRFEVFSASRTANFSDEALRERRDIDPTDSFSDHLLVIDPTRNKNELSIVGTYRLMSGTQSRAPGCPGFYSDDRFDISCLKSLDGEISELARVCIHPDYRDRGVMQLLWTGVASYISKYDIKIMFGCSGYVGTDPQQHAHSLSYLYHKHLAPEAIRPHAIGPNAIEIDVLPEDKIDRRTALREMPPIIKGYTRLGGWVAQGVSVNYLFNTIMVCVVVETSSITKRYSRHFIGNRQAA